MIRRDQVPTGSQPRPRVFLGPINIAGVLWEYAEGLRELGCEAQVGVLSTSFQSFRSDFTLSGANSVSPVRAALHRFAWFTRLAARFDVFHFDYGMTLLPRYLDLPILRMMGKRVVMHFMGSDIRCTRYEHGADYSDESIHCISCRDGQCQGAERERNIRRLRRYVDVFISTPDASFADLLPPDRTIVDSFVAVDLDIWAPSAEPMGSDTPLIVHAPSNPSVKGTPHVLEAVERLRSEGYRFEFRLLTGMSNEQVREVLQASDIVIDQLLLDTNGRLAVEAMALGKPVIGSLSDEYLQMFPTIPIVRATPDSLYQTLVRLLEDPEFGRERGRLGREFAEWLYDRRRVAERLLCIYTAPPSRLGEIRTYLEPGPA